MIDLTDEEIVTLVQHGNNDAFGELIDRYEAKMQRYIRRFLRRPEDVVDVVQEVFIKAYSNIQSFNTSLRFSPWLYRIAHNTSINEIKRQQRGFLHFFDLDSALPVVAADETADGEVMKKEMATTFEKYLDKLDIKYREPVILYFYEELTYQEISDILQIPVTTVGVRIKRGKDKLKILLDNEI